MRVNVLICGYKLSAGFDDTYEMGNSIVGVYANEELAKQALETELMATLSDDALIGEWMLRYIDEDCRSREDRAVPIINDPDRFDLEDEHGNYYSLFIEEHIVEQ